MIPADSDREPLRVLIVDDEELARQLLRRDLATQAGVEVVGEAANGFEAVKAVHDLSPDLLFLDIQMPKLSGFEVLELLDRQVAVIFLTAYDEYALRAFEVHAVDYLLKPYEPERLAAALARARQRLARHEPTPPGLAAAARPAGVHLERILVREEGRIQILPVATIDYIEARDDYVCFAVAGKKHRKQQTLSELESALDPQRFVRIHRSYLMNVERLRQLDLYAKDSYVAVLADGTRLPVSRSGHARLRELL